jgi:hypothetical protein
MDFHSTSRLLTGKSCRNPRNCLTVILYNRDHIRLAEASSHSKGNPARQEPRLYSLQLIESTEGSMYRTEPFEAHQASASRQSPLVSRTRMWGPRSRRLLINKRHDVSFRCNFRASLLFKPARIGLYADSTPRCSGKQNDLAGFN